MIKVWSWYANRSIKNLFIQQLYIKIFQAFTSKIICCSSDLVSLRALLCINSLLQQTVQTRARWNSSQGESRDNSPKTFHLLWWRKRKVLFFLNFDASLSQEAMLLKFVDSMVLSNVERFGTNGDRIYVISKYNVFISIKCNSEILHIIYLYYILNKSLNIEMTRR